MWKLRHKILVSCKVNYKNMAVIFKSVFFRMEEQVILYQGLLFEFQWNMRQTSSTLKGNEGELIRNLRE